MSKRAIWGFIHRYSFKRYVLQDVKKMESLTKEILLGDHPASIKFSKQVNTIKGLTANGKYDYVLRIQAKYMDFHTPSISELKERADIVFMQLSSEEKNRLVLNNISGKNGIYIFDYFIGY